MRCGALWRQRPTSNGCGLLWRSRHGRSLRSTSGIAVTRVRNSCGPICRRSTGSRRRFIRINMPSTPGSFRRRNTKPLRSTPAKRIISSASITLCGSASPASSVTLWPSLKTWRTTSVLSNTSFAITTSPGLQHYLYNTTLSRRNATVIPRQQVERASQGPVDLIVDSTGLKVCGQGEWHTQKHGQKKCKRWKKLRIGVDAQGQIVASTVTDSHEQDPSKVPELLSQVDRVIDRFIGDGIYDQEPVYAAVMNHSPGASVIIPPRKDAVLSRQVATAPTQRDYHLLAIERASRFDWKRASGYYDQAYAENVFSRFKRTFGDRLRAKRDASQEREASLACALRNRMRALGRPQSYLVSGKRSSRNHFTCCL